MGRPKGSKNKPKEIHAEVTMKEQVLHGMTGQAVIEPCPNCLYAYADGGYCGECGWSKPIVMGVQYP